MKNEEVVEHAKKIKEYCEQTICKKCVFAKREIRFGEILLSDGCGLQLDLPFDWEFGESEEQHNGRDE